MDYHTITVWDVIKRFSLGWLVAGLILVVVSCIKEKEYIISTFTDNVWALVNAAMPVVIIILGIVYLIKKVLR